MRVLMRSNDPVQLDFALALLKDAGLEATVFDSAMSIMEGSIGILPRRLMVADNDAAQARDVLIAGLGEAALEPEQA